MVHCHVQKSQSCIHSGVVLGSVFNSSSSRQNVRESNILLTANEFIMLSRVLGISYVS